jgi:hypothetical protein
MLLRSLHNVTTFLQSKGLPDRMSRRSSRLVAKSASQQTGASPILLPCEKRRPQTTSDNRYIIVNGRKWRATDPLIPADALAELKHYLAKGRSGVRGKKGVSVEDDESVKLARRRTGLAKLGLGERGKPEWWNDSDAGRKARWEGALEELVKLENR